jgi:hypothetical protein
MQTNHRVACTGQALLSHILVAGCIMPHQRRTYHPQLWLGVSPSIEDLVWMFSAHCACMRYKQQPALKLNSSMLLGCQYALGV